MEIGGDPVIVPKPFHRPPKPLTRVLSHPAMEIEGEPVMEIDGEPSYFIGQSSDDIAAALLSRFQNSGKEDHQHLCAAVGAMSQALKDEGIPLTPVAYFGAASSSLDRLSRDPTSGPDPVAAALLSFLSMVIPRVPAAVLRSKGDRVGDSMIRILGFGSLSISGMKAGLKCVAHMLVFGGQVNWSKSASLYSVLLGFVTHPHEKVRRQCRSCIRDVLRSFQGSAVLVPASEGIKSIFERSILLAGRPNSMDSTAAEGPKRATEVLYILEALKDFLTLMSLKFTNTILKCCKSLLPLQQPVVTRSVMEILQALCSSTTSEVAPDVLMDLLSALALCVADKEKSADEMASTGRLLHVGAKKVYDLNREVCIVKLPTIFSSLGDILASGHEEAIFAAAEALKGLIYSCIDENLVKQGVEQINLNSNRGLRKSGPTIIEKICATIEGFLDHPYDTDWGVIFQILSTAFDQLGILSSYLMTRTVKRLADMQKLQEENFSYGKQLEECIGSAIGAMGPEAFLRILPLNLENDDTSDANIWLLPILKQYIVGARLSYFLQNILDIISHVQQKSQKLEKEGRVFSARSADGLVYSLWSLLPAFCNYPVDTSSSFKELQKTLCNSISQEPDLRGIICTSLQILIRQNSEILSEKYLIAEDEISAPQRKAKELYTPQFAEKNLKAIRSFSSEFLSVLFNVFMACPKDTGGCLQSAIHEFASISDKKVVKKAFMHIMQQLLKVTQEVNKGKQNSSSSMQIDSASDKVSLSHSRALLLDLAVALLPGLGKEEIDLLFCAIKPAFQDDEGVIQKKAYKVLSIILKGHDDFLSSKLDDVLKLMIEGLTSCHFSAQRHRLDSLYFLIVHISKDPTEQRKTDVVSAFLTEIILALKEANKKTRNRAYELLVEIGHACGDEEKGGKKENLEQFFNMVAGGLAGEKPHMISAAVKGIARLAYEFSDLVSAAYNLLPSTYLLLQRQNREIVKASLGLVKVLVAKSKNDGLQVHLKGMVEGLLKWQDHTKSHFKAKVKLLIEMLVRKCSLEAVKAVMPEEHMKLLTNIRKIKERKERKAKSVDDAESLYSRTSLSRQSRWNHTHIFSDFGDEDNDSDGEHVLARPRSGRQTRASTIIGSKRGSLRSLRKHQASKSLAEDLLDQLEGDPLDLLDRQRTRSALQSSATLKRKAESDDEPELDSDGRLIVREGKSRKKEKSTSLDHDSDSRSQLGSRSSVQSIKKSKKHQKVESGWAYTGNEYTTKKAGGDVKKKDKLEPYAYWPLDRKLLNRRAEHKATARKGMASVMKFAKRLEGKSASNALSVKGMKLKKSHKKGSKKR